MATCTFRVGTADTGVTPNPSGAFTPAVGDLLVVYVVATDISTANAASSTLTSSVGITFTCNFASWVATYATSAHQIFLFVANSFVASATSQTVSFDNVPDPATGTIIFVFSIAGMSRTGSAAVRQVQVSSNQGAGGIPAGAFGTTTLTTNPTIACVGNSTSPATLTPPTGWTEPATGDLGYATPTTGGEVCFRDSGFGTGSYAYGSSSATAFGNMMAEFDASIPKTPYNRIPTIMPILTQ